MYFIIFFLKSFFIFVQNNIFMNIVEEIKKQRKVKSRNVLGLFITTPTMFYVLSLSIPHIWVWFSFFLFFELRFFYKVIKSSNEIKRLELEDYKKSSNDFYKKYNKIKNDPNFDVNSLFEDVLNDLLKKHGIDPSTIYAQTHKAPPPPRRFVIPMADAYRVLKLTPSDTEDTIKKRYRELANKYHPDKWNNGSIREKAAAERNFKKLNEYYSMIKKDRGIK